MWHGHPNGPEGEGERKRERTVVGAPAAMEGSGGGYATVSVGGGVEASSVPDRQDTSVSAEGGEGAGGSRGGGGYALVAVGGGALVVSEREGEGGSVTDRFLGTRMTMLAIEGGGQNLALEAPCMEGHDLQDTGDKDEVGDGDAGGVHVIALRHSPPPRNTRAAAEAGSSETVTLANRARLSVLDDKRIDTSVYKSVSEAIEEFEKLVAM